MLMKGAVNSVPLSVVPPLGLDVNICQTCIWLPAAYTICPLQEDIAFTTSMLIPIDLGPLFSVITVQSSPVLSGYF
jgi:hypothetical protein